MSPWVSKLRDIKAIGLDRLRPVKLDPKRCLQPANGDEMDVRDNAVLEHLELQYYSRNFYGPNKPLPKEEIERHESELRTKHIVHKLCPVCGGV
jgi:hypothetical protein